MPASIALGKRPGGGTGIPVQTRGGPLHRSFMSFGLLKWFIPPEVKLLTLQAC